MQIAFEILPRCSRVAPEVQIGFEVLTSYSRLAPEVQIGFVVLSRCPEVHTACEHQKVPFGGYGGGCVAAPTLVFSGSLRGDGGEERLGFVHHRG